MTFDNQDDSYNYDEGNMFEGFIATGKAPTSIQEWLMILGQAFLRIMIQATEEKVTNYLKLILEDPEIDVDIEEMGKYNETPLYSAISGRFKDISILLIDHHANVNANSEDSGDTPLRAAARKGLVEICSLLIQKGANVNMEDHHSSTPLHSAAFSTIDTCTLLIQEGAVVDAQDEDGNTPLHKAAEQGNQEACAVLLQNNAQLLQNNENKTPIDVAKDDEIKGFLQNYFSLGMGGPS